MLDPKKRSEMDQAQAFLGELYPPLWRKLYLGCVEEGFSEDQAFRLLRTYIRAVCDSKEEDG